MTREARRSARWLPRSTFCRQTGTPARFFIDVIQFKSFARDVAEEKGRVGSPTIKLEQSVSQCVMAFPIQLKMC